LLCTLKAHILLEHQWLYDKETVKQLAQVSMYSCTVHYYFFSHQIKIFSCLLISSICPCILANWWSVHGGSAKDLRKLAIRILSLTCSSSACERNWSAFERVSSPSLD
jgi:hypothetical protein